MFILNESFYIDYLQIKVRWIRSMYKPVTYKSDMQYPHTIAWLVFEGSWRMIVQGKEQIAKAGDLLLFPPNTLIGLQAGEESIRYLSMCADLKVGNLDLVTLYGLPALTPLPSSAEREKLASIWRHSVQAFDTLGELITARKPATAPSDTNTHMIHTDISLSFLGLQGLVYQWLQQFLTIMRHRLPDEPLRFDHRVMKVCDYIQHHIDEPLRLDELAGHVHLSVSHLSHLFVKTLGLSPLEYVRKARIQLTKELLMHSTYTIKEIADKIGYKEQSQLSRLFQQSEGMSPNQFRNAVHASLSI